MPVAIERSGDCFHVDTGQDGCECKNGHGDILYLLSHEKCIGALLLCVLKVRSRSVRD